MVVDTSSILQRLDQALESPRYWCYFPADEVTILYKKAPVKSIQNQIYRNKFNKDCVLEQAEAMDSNSKNYQLFKENGFLIGTYTFCNVLVNIMSSIDNKARYWVSSRFEGMNFAQILRKSQKEKQKKILVS